MTRSQQGQQAQPQPVALFVSDVHLQESMPATTAAFLHFLQQHARHAQQLYVLGDLFEYWAGDDDLDAPLHAQVVAALRAVSDAGTAVFWIAGNRDFLVGAGFAAATGATLLDDGTVVQLAGQRIVLAHGDAQCTDDTAYIAFRNQVRHADWQRDFLAMPLVQRKAIIDNMRVQSRAAQHAKSAEIMDVNPAAIAALFDASDATIMIHGHTHRPATHVTQVGNQQRIRHVLPDWDCEALPRRGGWLAIDASGRILSHDADGTPA
ncbi:UDP-2,3-diacylglucosamine hydrolase [Actimicrobium sp. GrIS 1.19]|uniref:UDP-2,3-diacylglucosamine diphosphatase n=1 Tax=Actimicrobium sp. GrIS 1.19 TaxID=3071708 RepID=UPI002E047FFB|nr:UDP-2,3-diacylglucosamine hydrolase [Actimicrobium sp. GrIS 1.19]